MIENPLRTADNGVVDGATGHICTVLEVLRIAAGGCLELVGRAALVSLDAVGIEV